MSPKCLHGEKLIVPTDQNGPTASTGLYAYKAMLNGNGLDQRTSLFKALREKEQELVKAIAAHPLPWARLKESTGWITQK